MRTDPRVVAELRALFLAGATPWRLVRHIASRHDGDPDWAAAVGSYFAEAFSVSTLALDCCRRPVDLDGPPPAHLDAELLRDMVGRMADWRTPGDPAWCDGLSVSPDGLAMIDGLRPEAHPALAESWELLPPRVKEFVRQAMTNAQGYYEYAQVLARLAERLQQQVVELERRNQEVEA
jgi:hypothetical protein